MNNEEYRTEWKCRLERAATELENSPGVPDWLKLTVRDAIPASDHLVPQRDYQPYKDSYIYPH